MGVLRITRLSRALVCPCMTAMLALMAGSCSCSDGQKPFPADARGAAEYYYQCLLDSDYNAWVDGTLYSEALIPDIRQERIDMLRQYMNDEQRLRNGIVSVRSLRDTVVDDNAFVFMQICFGDSTCEETMLPMVKVGDRWKMK